MNRNSLKFAAFYLGIGLIFTHELDAMSNNEWLVLPLTSWLPNSTGQFVFVVAHIPLFAVVVGLLASENSAMRARTRFFVAAFLVLHGVLHAAFVAHESYEFESVLSNVLIFGAALCGAIYLALNRTKTTVSGAEKDKLEQ